MALQLRRYFYCISLPLLLFLPMASKAQTSVWSGTNAAKSKVMGAKHKMKDFKDHLEKWGLDTNYNHAFLLGGKLNSDGWSGSMYFVKRKVRWKNYMY